MFAIDKNLKIALAADHAGFELKEYIRKTLEIYFTLEDFGCFSNSSVDYPDFAVPAAQAVSRCKADKGILVCGSGTGMSIAANKVPHIRAANCQSVEIAQLAVSHNNINVLCIGARFVSNNLAVDIIDAFLSSKFEAGRHLNRVNKIHTFECHSLN